ncbi:MAG: sugar kinase [Pseudomonadota bacterium]
MTSVLCIGEAMVEVAMASDTAREAGIGFAGDTLNTAIYLKRSAPDLRVAYATKLGQDKLSDRMVAFMAEEGLDTRLVLRDPDRMPGLYAISTDTRGERSFMYWRDFSAARQLFEAPALSFEDIVRFDLVYFSAITLAILSPDHRALLTDLLSRYRASGGRVAFDSNYRPRLWETPDAAQEAIATAWRLTDVGLPSVDDEQALFGDGTEAEVLARLAGFGLRLGALKRGAMGPLALDGTPAGRFAPAERVVDSTAAGDSFNSGYLATLLSGGGQQECLEAGHNLAARVVSIRGAIAPRAEEPAQ